MMYFRSCPRCSGDMALESDRYGVYRSCVQCGCVRDLADERGHQIPAYQPSLFGATRGRKPMYMGIPLS